MNWCFDCGSALAEAEVEYHDKTDLAVDVGFVLRKRQSWPKPSVCQKLPHDVGYLVIWTTTPWTLPANQALNLHPEFDYAGRDDRCCKAAAAAGAGACRGVPANWDLQGKVIATCKGEALERVAFHHPVLRPFEPGVSGRLRHARHRNRHRAFGASLRRRGLPVLPCLRHEGRRGADAGDGRWQIRRTLPVFGGLSIWDANPNVEHMREGLAVQGPKFQHSYMHCWRHRTPIIYRAANQWFAGMDVTPRRVPRCVKLR